MYVISLVSNGDLVKTALKPNPNNAVQLAKDWYDQHKPGSTEDDYIAIDQQVKGQEENSRFAIIRFVEGEDEVKLYLGNGRLPEFNSRYKEIARDFFMAALEYALLRVTDHIKNKDR